MPYECVILIFLRGVCYFFFFLPFCFSSVYGHRWIILGFVSEEWDAGIDRRDVDESWCLLGLTGKIWMSPDVCCSAGVLEACPKHQSLYPVRVLFSVGKEASGNFLSLECWVINQLSGFGLPGWGRNGSHHPLGYRLWLLVIKSPPFWLYFLDLGSPAEPGDLQLWVFAEWLLPCECWLPGSL